MVHDMKLSGIIKVIMLHEAQSLHQSLL